jgi:hypothetical protein
MYIRHTPLFSYVPYEPEDFAGMTEQQRHFAEKVKTKAVLVETGAGECAKLAHGWHTFEGGDMMFTRLYTKCDLSKGPDFGRMARKEALLKKWKDAGRF